MLTAALLAVSLALPLTATARAAANAPAAQGVDRSVTQRDGSLAQLQRLLSAVTRGYPVGTVAQVRGPGAGAWSSAAGVRSLRTQRPAAPDDRFRIASVTKPMIATLVMQQVARGRWSLDTRAGRVLPRLLRAYPTVTIRQLLSHTSGLPDYLGALLADVDTLAELRTVISRRYSDRRLVRAALTLPATGRPGAEFAYSNTNYVLLGMMLRKATGRSVGQLLRHRIFGPAGMHDSTFDTTRGIWRAHLEEYARIDRLYSLRTFNPTTFSSAGAVVSTTDDVNRFFRALLRGRFLPQRLVSQMLRPASAAGYGLGTYAIPDPCPAADGSAQLLYGHDGASFGTRTLSYSSRDGRRQVTMAWTGRDLTTVQDPAAPWRFLLTAYESTCPRPVPSITARATARAGRIDRLAAEIAARSVDTRGPMLNTR